MEGWSDDVSYSLNRRQRWRLPARLDQLFSSQQLEQLQQEQYDLIAVTSQDPNLYPENQYVAQTRGVKSFYQSQSEQTIFKGTSK